MVFSNRVLRIEKLYAVLVSLLVLSGCSSQRIPEPMAIRADKVTSYKLDGGLYVKNEQTNKQQVDLGKIGVMQVQGDLHSWTDTAVKVLKAELIRRGASIDDNASTGLGLSVDRVEMGVSGLKFAGMPMGKVFLSVNTAKGYNATYEGEYTTISAYKAGDGAITAAVESMLNDPIIQDFLSGLGQ